MKGERESRVVPPFPESPDVSVHSRETCFPCTSSPFLCSAPPLEMRRKRWEFFPEEAGKDPYLEFGGGNGAPLEWPDPRASSGVETGISGNLLSCSKGV